MMKFAMLLCLLALVACNGEEGTPSDGTNGIIQFVEAPMSSDDAARLRAICSALGEKEDQLSVLISSQYNFSYSYKGCDDSSHGAAQNISTTIERPYGNYVFMRTDGDSFAFPDVETRSNGTLTKFCSQAGGDIMSAVRTSDSSAMWVTTKTNAKRCSAGSDAYCVHVQRGSLVSGDSYRIHTNEYMKIKLTNPRRGFFIEKLVISTAPCSKGKAVEKKVVLK